MGCHVEDETVGINESTPLRYRISHYLRCKETFPWYSHLIVVPKLSLENLAGQVGAADGVDCVGSNAQC